MSGICSKHKGHDPDCRLCTYMVGEGLYPELWGECSGVDIPSNILFLPEGDGVTLFEKALEALRENGARPPTAIYDTRTRSTASMMQSGRASTTVSAMWLRRRGEPVFAGIDHLCRVVGAQLIPTANVDSWFGGMTYEVGHLGLPVPPYLPGTFLFLGEDERKIEFDENLD